MAGGCRRRKSGGAAISKHQPANASTTYSTPFNMMTAVSMLTLRATNRSSLQAVILRKRWQYVSFTRYDFSTNTSYPDVSSPSRSSDYHEKPRPKARCTFVHRPRSRNRPTMEKSLWKDSTSQTNMMGSTNLGQHSQSSRGASHNKSNEPMQTDEFESQSSNRYHANTRRFQFYDYTPKWQPKNKINSDMSVAKDITTSEWVVVTGIPPMSKLSDLTPSLSDILEFELNKGIIDLDATLKHNRYAPKLSATFKDPKCYQALKEMDALHSLYLTQDIRSQNDIPICKLDINPDESLTSQLIVEARLHLSYRARPQGWFLKFTNRSIAHAVRCHVAEAGRHEELLREQFDKERRAVRQDRRGWIEGLWKGVRAEYAANEISKKNSAALNDGVEDRQLMWGDEVIIGEDFKNDEHISFTEHSDDSNERNDIDVNGEQSFFEEYSKTHPYPMHSTAVSSVESVFGLHRLKCGSSSLTVRAFSPASSPGTKHPSAWEQHSFHLGNMLELSDSCIRVETNALNVTVDDIKYLFRGFDVMSIYSEASESKIQLPPSFSQLPKSIGWNLKRYESDYNGNPHHAVDILVRGKRNVGNQQNGYIDYPRSHMFLIRLATPADARMAIRTNQDILFKESRLMLAQYPRAEI